MTDMIGDTIKMVAVFAAAVTGGMATNHVIDNSTHIPLGLVVSVMVTAIGIAVAISRAMQRFQDSMDNMRDEFKTLQNHVFNLPCQKSKCEEDKSADS